MILVGFYNNAQQWLKNNYAHFFIAVFSKCIWVQLTEQLPAIPSVYWSAFDKVPIE